MSWPQFFLALAHIPLAAAMLRVVMQRKWAFDKYLYFAFFWISGVIYHLIVAFSYPTDWFTWARVLILVPIAFDRRYLVRLTLDLPTKDEYERAIEEKEWLEVRVKRIESDFQTLQEWANEYQCEHTFHAKACSLVQTLRELQNG